MTIVSKTILAWLLLFVVLVANGAIRVLVLQPPLAGLSGLALVLLVSWLFVRSTPAACSAHLWRVGGAWLIATVAFEFLFGHFVSGQLQMVPVAARPAGHAARP
jgi:hypothetical protein